MAQTAEDIVIDIVVNYNDAIVGITKYNKKIIELKNEQKRFGDYKDLSSFLLSEKYFYMNTVHIT